MELKEKTRKSKNQLIKGEDSVLVIVDIQEKLLPVISKHKKIIKNIVRLIRFAKIIGMPVVLTEQEKLGSTIKEIKAELPDLAPIKKIEFSACKNSEFIRKIQKLSRSNIILAGIETHICITQTALELATEFNVHVIGDATSSRSIEDRDIALQRLTQSGVVVSSTEMVIYELLEKAGTSEFKEALDLIK